MINLSWKIKELGDLNDMGRLLHIEIDGLLRRMKAGHCLWEHENVPRRLSEIWNKLSTFIKGITRHQCTPASHILVFMISNEERRTKPYATPVQCIPYKSLTDLKVRELANKVIQEMTRRKMKVAGRLLVHFMFNHCNYNIIGFTTDGEWNSLCSKGNTRPLSVFQILSNARRKYAQKKQQTMIEMLSPLRKYACLNNIIIVKYPGNANGIFTARVPNNAVSQDLLAALIHGWITAGASMDDVVERLRLRTVPTGYAIHNWINGIAITHALCKLSHHFFTREG